MKAATRSTVTLPAYTLALAFALAPTFLTTATPETPAAREAGAEVYAEGSIVAVLTHRGGIAGSLAHDHLIAAPPDAVRIAFDPADPERASLRLETSAGALTVDDTDARTLWSPRLRALGLIDRDLQPLAAGDRRKIRKAMLARGQLDDAGHPAIRAATGAVHAESHTLGDVVFPWTVDLELEAAGDSAKAAAYARFEREPLRVEAVAEFAFTDLGIEPYSAMLGAVRNRDRFHVYVSLLLDEPVGAEPGGSPR